MTIVNQLKNVYFTSPAMAHVFKFVKGATNKGKVQISMNQCINALDVIKDYRMQFEELFAYYH